MRGTLLAALLASACTESPFPVREKPGPWDELDSGSSDETSSPTDTSGSATGETGTPTEPEPVLVEVSHDREMRGVWIATVANINWPSAQGLSASAQQAELISLLDVCADAGLNAVFFQIRPEADALYASTIEPWSRYLTGTQGQDPGYDPLALLVTEAHARGLEVHAWLNPYRAKADYTSTAASNHASVVFSDHAYRYANTVWLDPGAPEVQDHTVLVVTDIVSRYDVDGIHFDDYFYPYPDGTAFPDAATYAQHGGGLALDDWRRDNVNELMRRVSEAVALTKPWVRFGIGPFGIYRPGQPPGISGLDQYAELYADPPLWKASGWVDYLAPQLYWPTTQTAQAYEPLLDWWSALPEDGRYTFPGNALYQLGATSAWTIDEFREQVALTRSRAGESALGNIWYNVTHLQQDTDGIRGVFRDELYPTPALPPPVFDLRDQPVDPPLIEPDASGVQLSHPDARWWVVYAEDGAIWTIDRIVPATEASIALDPGRWAISAAARHGVESAGVLVER